MPKRMVARSNRLVSCRVVPINGIGRILSLIISPLMGMLFFVPISAMELNMTLSPLSGFWNSIRKKNKSTHLGDKSDYLLAMYDAVEVINMPFAVQYIDNPCSKFGDNEFAIRINHVRED
jgi:hypothetical protein